MVGVAGETLAVALATGKWWNRLGLPRIGFFALACGRPGHRQLVEPLYLTWRSS